MNTTAVPERITGNLMGLAAGDRIGGPLQFALRLAESLREGASYERSDVLRRYLALYREGTFDTGPVADRVLSLALTGKPVDSAVIHVDRELARQTAGRNPAHRVAPIAMALTYPMRGWPKRHDRKPPSPTTNRWRETRPQPWRHFPVP